MTLADNSIPEITDDLLLLHDIIIDGSYHNNLYSPGSYWDRKSKNAISEIKRCGIKDFRGGSNLIGQSYSDNSPIDIRSCLDFGLRKILLWVTKLYPFSIIFNEQVELTRNYYNTSIQLYREMSSRSPRIKELLLKYKVPYSLLGGCKSVVKVNGVDYSIHYLNLLEQHDNLSTHIQFDNVHTVFEIGGGFGTNIHLLIENYPNIKKVIYLDILPNLYVGIQYLKAFYGDAVCDYNTLKKADVIKFSDNNELEIFCIPPWKIENLQTPIDLFMNSHSFVEMPKEVASNYANHIMKLGGTELTIALISYSNYDPTTTFAPSDLPKFFAGGFFQSFECGTLMNTSVTNLYYISDGKPPRNPYPYSISLRERNIL